MALIQGQAAPDFTLPRNGGDLLTLSDLRGQKVVLFVYPQDGTPTCTDENRQFSERAAEFAAAGAVVIGLSPDSVRKHDNFVAKHELQIPLLSDPDKSVIEPWGLWVQKKLYGREYMGVERTTILIDAEGRVAQVWPKVKLKGHVDEVLAAVQAL